MRCLTIMQPWASLIITGKKRFETRSWRANHQGPMAIHSSKRMTPAAIELCELEPFKTTLASISLTIETLPKGLVLGTVVLEGAQKIEELPYQLTEEERAFGDYRPGRWAWNLSHPTPLAVPFEWRGGLGLCTIPDNMFLFSHLLGETNRAPTQPKP